jgi:hypothetical protein
LDPTVNVQNRFYKSCSRKTAQSYAVSSRTILSPFYFSGKNGLLEEEEEITSFQPHEADKATYEQ